MSRFDHIELSGIAGLKVSEFKAEFIKLEAMMAGLMVGRSLSTAITKLEECSMWVGKAIRDEQLQRDGRGGL